MQTQEISIHAPLTGSDHDGYAIINFVKNFNPRSPYGERLRAAMAERAAQGFQSTLPLRGATTQRG